MYGIDSLYSDTYTLYPPLSNPSNNTKFITTSLYFLLNVETYVCYVVNYIKIQEIIANLGGILNTITIFFNLISSVFNVHERESPF